jgi:formyl-CoA transferase
VALADQADRDDGLSACGAIVSVSHPEYGTFKTVASPLRLSDVPVTVTSPSLLGEHNREIYAELGYGPADLAELSAEGII